MNNSKTLVEKARQARTVRKVAQHEQAVGEINRRQWADISTERLVEKANELQVRMDELGNAPLYTPQQRHIDAMRAEINRRLQTVGDREYQDGQTPMSHMDARLHKHQSSSSPANVDQGLSSASHCALADADSRLERVQAQRRHIRGEKAAARWKAYQTKSSAVERRLNRHIALSVPCSLKTSHSMIRRTWFLIHYKVALFALRQALQAAGRLGLSQIEDSAGFVRGQCAWYVYFCRLGSWLFPAEYKNCHILAYKK